MHSTQDLIKEQDQQLDEISEIAQRLHMHAKTINTELKDQGVMLNRLDKQIDEDLEKMNFVMKKLGKLLKTSDSRTLCTVLTLTVILVVLMMLVFYT